MNEQGFGTMYEAIPGMEPLKRFVLRKHGNLALVAFLPVWLVGTALMCAILLREQVSAPTEHTGQWLLLAGLLVVGAHVLRIWLWHLHGKEVVTAYPGHVEIARRGSFGHPTLTIPVIEIEEIGVASPQETPGWLRWWGFSGGSARITYRGRSVLFGQDLPPQVAERIVRDLRVLYGPPIQ